MAYLLQRLDSSHNAQLVATGILSGIAVAGTIFTIQAIRRQDAVQVLKASIPDIDAKHPAQKLTDYGAASPLPSSSKEDERAAALATRARQGDYDEELISEQLTRTSSFLTPSRLAPLRASFVIIVGLGGVGSHCVSALARSGVSHIRLIDFDQVTLSSLNRHSVATLADVGTPKVNTVKRRLEAVVPWVEWECHNEIFREAEAQRLLGPWGSANHPGSSSTHWGAKIQGRKPDYVIDCIDNIDSKVSLLHYCHTHSLPVISSMGAGCKSDPTRVFLGDISSSLEDPLSRAVRRRLRVLGISEGIPVAYSTEKPGPGKASLMPLPDEEFEKGDVGELSVLPNFRARILPVLGTMPAVFGLVLANWVIMELSAYPHEMQGCGGKGREKLYDAVLGQLQGMEERLCKWDAVKKGGDGEDVKGLKMPITKDDVEYLIEEVFRGKSVVSGVPTRLMLLRWSVPPGGFEFETKWEGQNNSKIKLGDLVLMTKEEGAVHEREVLKGRRDAREIYGDEVFEMVQKRFGEEAAYRRFR